MAERLQLHGRRFTVETTAADGVVNSDTLFEFQQQESLVSASYSGGRVQRGFLVGLLNGTRLEFSYCQVHDNNEFKTGHSNATVDWTGSLVRITEEFEWADGSGSGINIFVELK